MMIRGKDGVYVAAAADAGEFDEGKHPRADNGQFGKGGGGASKKAAPAKGAEPKDAVAPSPQAKTDISSKVKSREDFEKVLTEKFGDKVGFGGDGQKAEAIVGGKVVARFERGPGGKIKATMNAESSPAKSAEQTTKNAARKAKSDAKSDAAHAKNASDMTDAQLSEWNKKYTNLQFKPDGKGKFTLQYGDGTTANFGNGVARYTEAEAEAYKNNIDKSVYKKEFEKRNSAPAKSAEPKKEEKPKSAKPLVRMGIGDTVELHAPLNGPYKFATVKGFVLDKNKLGVGLNDPKAPFAGAQVQKVKVSLKETQHGRPQGTAEIPLSWVMHNHSKKDGGKSQAQDSSLATRFPDLTKIRNGY